MRNNQNIVDFPPSQTGNTGSTSLDLSPHTVVTRSRRCWNV